MHAAFSIWEQRIAPVFDVAAEAAIVPDSAGGGITRIPLPGNGPEAIISALLDHGVTILVCGAISRPLHDRITNRDITVHAFVTGELSDVIQAWRSGTLCDGRFTMPGCGQKSANDRGQGHRMRRRGSGKNVGRNTTISGYGATVMAEDADLCRCPQCGHEQTHVPGIPCSRQRCPNCQALMVRA